MHPPPPPPHDRGLLKWDFYFVDVVVVVVRPFELDSPKLTEPGPGVRHRNIYYHKKR